MVEKAISILRKYKQNFFKSKVNLIISSVLLVLVFTDFISDVMWSAYGSNDWDYHYAITEVSKKAVLEYGEFPHWNPWSGGGYDYLANPQTFPMGVVSVLSFILPTHYALKVGYLGFYIIGFWGMFKLLRSYELSRKYAYWGSCLFVFTTYFSWHLIYGSHANTTEMFLFPWLIFFYENYKKRGISLLNFIIPVLLFFHIAFGGGTHFVIYIPVFFGAYILVDTIASKRKASHLLYPIIIIFIGYGLMLWKLYPSFQYLSENERITDDHTKAGILNLLQMISDSVPANETHSFTYWHWSEHGAYFNLLLVVLVFYYRKTINLSTPWIIFFICIVWLSMGNFPKIANPWFVLNQYAPVFKSMRVPYRMIIFAIFLLSIWSAKLFYKKESEHHLWRIVAITVVVLLLVKNYSVTRNLRYSGTTKDHLSLVSSNDSFRYVQQGYVTMYPNILENTGVLNSYEPLPLKYDGFKDLRFDSIPQTYIPIIDANQGKLVKWTPSSITFEKIVSEPIVLNQNYSEGWNVISGDMKIINTDDKIGISGKINTVGTISYRNPHLITGLYMSSVFLLMFFAGTIYIIWRNRTRPSV